MDALISGITLVGLAIGFFLAVVLLLHGSGPPGTRTLGLLMLLVAGMGTMQTLVSRSAESAVVLGFFMAPLAFYYGPLTYFYTKKVLFRVRFTPRDYLLHSIPVWLMLAAHIVVHLLYWEEVNIENIRNRQGVMRVMVPGFLLPIEVWTILYASVSLRLLLAYVRRAQEQFAHDVLTQVRWLRFFLVAQILGLSPHALIVLASLFFGEILPLYLFDAVIVTAFNFAIFYYLIKKPYVFNLSEEPTRAGSEPTPKYRKQTLDAAARRALLDRLDEYMRDEQAYLDDAINLNQVADHLSVPPHHVSMSINAELGLNFYSFVNKFRLEEVTRMLADPDMAEENVLNIAFRAGFRSKAAFNRVFKEHTKLSPRAYRLRALRKTS